MINIYVLYTNADGRDATAALFGILGIPVKSEKPAETHFLITHKKLKQPSFLGLCVAIMILEFYTTAAEERTLNEDYQKRLSEYPASKSTAKFTAAAFVHQAPRRFQIRNGLIQNSSGSAKPILDGKKYCLDPDFADTVRIWSSQHSNYDIIFYPSGSYGPTVSYLCETPRVFPARLVCAETGEQLVVEDEKKYELLVG